MDSGSDLGSDILETRLNRRRFLTGAAALGGAVWIGAGRSDAATAAVAKGPVAPAVGRVVATGLGRPVGLHVANGVVHIADFDRKTGSPGRILRYRGGQVTTMLDDGQILPTDVVLDRAGNVYFSNYASAGVDVLRVGSTARSPFITGLADPAYLTIDAAGTSLFVADTGEEHSGTTDEGHNRVRRYQLSKPSVTSVVAGSGPPQGSSMCAPTTAAVAATSVALRTPFGLALDGNVLYVADQYQHVVHRVDLTTGKLTRYAGTCSTSRASGDNGPALNAAVRYPQGLTVDGAGNLYILQYEGQVRRVDKASGKITTIFTRAAVGSNTDIGFDASDSSLYITAPKDAQSVLIRITQT